LKEKINGIKKSQNYSINIKSALFDIRIWKIASIASLSSFALGFSVNTFRVYGALVSINGTFMQYSGGVGAIILFIGTPIWGYINDNVDFTYIIKIICISSNIQSLLLSIFLSNHFAYILCILFGCLVSCGLMTSIRPHIMHVYGIEYTLEIGGVVGICTGIVNSFGSIIAYIISKYYKTGEELQKPYKYLFFIGAILCIISFYLALNEGNDKFIFPNILNKDKLYNIQKNDFSTQRETRKNKIYIQLNNM
jgi:MFS family permease